MGLFTPQVAGSLVSGLFGMIGQRRQIKAQQRENELAFQRNQALAKMQNQFNIDQWNRANAYNSPSNQMKLLKAAGLNPDLAMGGTSGMTAATSPSMSAGTPYNPVDHTLGGNRQTFGDIFNTIMQNRLLESQIGKTDSEKTGQDLKNKSIFEMDQAEIQQYYSTIGLNKKQIAQLDKVIESLDITMDKEKSNIELIKAQIANTNADEWSKRVLTRLSEREFDEIKLPLADANIRMSNAQINRIVKMLPYEISALDMSNQKDYSQILLNLANHAGILSENESKELEAIINGDIIETFNDENDEFFRKITAATKWFRILISNIVPILSSIK